MKIVKSFKYRLKTNTEIKHKMENFCGGARFVWNKFLALNLARLAAGEKIFWYYQMCYWLTLWKSSQEYGFLKECSSSILQQKLKDLDRAFRDCFDKNQPGKRMPCWRKKQIHNSFRYPTGFKVEDKRVFLPKIGWVNFFNSRRIVGRAKNVTISKSGKHWYVSIQTEQNVDAPVHSSNSEVGIDLGIVSFATLSDGRQINSPKPLSKVAKKLARQQRLVAKKKRGSKNRARANQKVAVLHQKVANVRKDFLHKLSYDICKNHAQIVIENLKVKNMSKSVKGTLDLPGKNVKAKSRLNRSILDQGWGEFRRQLSYKAFWFGGLLVEVDARYTSQKCSSCYYVDANNRKTQENFLCQSCGYTENADVNAAINILAAGQAVSACGEVPVGVFSEAGTTGKQRCKSQSFS
jgi:putative transposase